jgi:DNA-binding IclR family transcriptional regulator
VIQSVKRAMDILFAVSNCRQDAMRLCDISEALNIRRSTCAHLVGTLCQMGYLEQKSRNEGYQIGYLAHYIARKGGIGQQLIKTCSPVMRWLTRATGQTTILAVLRGNHKLIIHYIEGERKMGGLCRHILLGNLYSSATGRMLLACQDEETVIKLIEQSGLPTIDQWEGCQSTESLLKQLNDIRRQGFARYCSSSLIGYSSDLKNCKGNIAALGIACNKLPKDEQQLIHQLKRATRELNRRLSLRHA